jgi:putative serine protease PepD
MQHEHATEDPWAPPTRAHAWGYPTGPIGETPPELPRRTVPPVALLVLTALASGLLGGYVGARTAGPSLPSASSLRDPGATIPSASPASSARPSTSVAGIAARVLRSVVSIDVSDGEGSGTGSGVVLSRDGFVLTNNHVVAGAATGGTITVSFNDGSVDLPARVVGRDPETDLAVIRVVGATSLTPAELGSSSGLAVGDPVVAIGSPLGLAGTVTSGIISALDRTVQVPRESSAVPATPLFDAIQTDAAINPGNSGGPLVDASGRVIGINSAIASLSSDSASSQSGSIGVGFAIPVDEARSIAEQLIRTGRATHPAIGVSATTVGSDGVGPRGARLVSLEPSGAAAKAGLRVGDVVTRVGGRPVQGVDQLVVALRRYRVGQSVQVTYVRAGTTRTAEVVLQDKKAS